MTFTVSLPSGNDWIKSYQSRLPIAIKSAGYQIQQVVKPLAKSEHDFIWIQSEMLSPAFQHLCFRYKYNIYSVLIGLQQGETLYISEQDMSNQMDVCSQNNMIPCFIPLDIRTYAPILPGSHMLSTETMQPITIEAGDIIPMSDWEILDFAISIVRSNIEKDGGKIQSYCNVPEINPQLWFSDKDGHPSYVMVNAHRSSETPNFVIGKQMVKRFERFNGYYADVSIGAANSDGLMRGCATFISYKGLELIRDRTDLLEDQELHIVRDNKPALKNRNQYWEEVKEYLIEKGINPEDGDYTWYADGCAVISQYTHNKMSTRDMMLVQDKLSDLLLGLTPTANTSLIVDDPIKGQIKAMRLIPEIQNADLNYLEKEALAFCVYYSRCVQKHDNKNGKTIPTIYDFKSFETIDDEYKHTKKVHPELFRTDEIPSRSGRLGYDNSCPLRLGSVSYSYRYLEKLKCTDGIITHYERLSSEGPDSHILYVWEFTIEKTKFFFIKKRRKVILYVDCYASGDEKIAPNGFILK